MKRVSLILLSILAGHAAAASAPEEFAKWGQFEREFEEEQVTWQEIQSQLPAAPKADALHEFEMGGRGGHRYFLDLASLSSGEDGVVRYTVVIRTSGGAENINFEGMRCVNGERKIYAFGRGDGQWSRNKYARWDPIDARGATSYHRELFFHYFCTVDGPGDLKLIRRAIERGGIRRGGD